MVRGVYQPPDLGGAGRQFPYAVAAWARGHGLPFSPLSAQPSMDLDPSCDLDRRDSN